MGVSMIILSSMSVNHMDMCVLGLFLLDKPHVQGIVLEKEVPHRPVGDAHGQLGRSHWVENRSVHRYNCHLDTEYTSIP